MGGARGVMFLVTLLASTWPAIGQAHEPSSPIVEANDNRRPAGDMRGTTWHLELRAAHGEWQPEGPLGSRLKIEAFGEIAGPLMVPAPLIRVRASTEVLVSVRNDLGAPLRVHGLCARAGRECPPLEIPVGQARWVRFAVESPGTYHYWATTTGMPLTFRGGPDSQLSGAFVVDPPHGVVEADRVLVITEWDSLTLAQLADLAAHPDPSARFLELRPFVLFTVNGLAPHGTPDLRRRRGRALARDQLEHPTAPHAFARLLLRHRAPGRRPAR